MPRRPSRRNSRRRSSSLAASPDGLATAGGEDEVVVDSCSESVTSKERGYCGGDCVSRERCSLNFSGLTHR